MGRTWIEGFLEDGTLQLEQAVRIHLSYNHYPPIPEDFIPNAVEAINKANDGLWDEGITLANNRVLPVWQIVEELHLESFLEGEEVEDDECDDY